jgi:hypothetical protein
MKNTKGVTITGGGLKCDNPLCDYKDMSIPTTEYKKYVDCPCPKCGSNLLTKADYRSSKIINGIVKVINFICFFIPKKKLGNDLATMTIEYDGSGIPKTGEIKLVNKDN